MLKLFIQDAFITKPRLLSGVLLKINTIKIKNKLKVIKVSYVRRVTKATEVCT